jgi:hypothetical protein
VVDLAEVLTAQLEGCTPDIPSHGRRVAEKALALADLATQQGVALEGLPLRPREREAITLAAMVHSVVDVLPLSPMLSRPRLDSDALTALGYRLRWIREICRSRAMVRSIYDGGGFYPPADPAGPAAVDYGVRASEIEGILAFLEEINHTGPRSEKERQRLTHIARRSLEMEGGPDVPYLTETEYSALAASESVRRDEAREVRRERQEQLRERLTGVHWPPALAQVPDLVEALLGGAGPHAGLPARLLVVAEAWDGLMGRVEDHGNGLPLNQVLGCLKRDADTGLLDRTLIRVLERSGLLPHAPSPSAGGEVIGEPSSSSGGWIERPH